jgi:lipid-binding SYLF domain-containing protein
MKKNKAISMLTSLAMGIMFLGFMACSTSLLSKSDKEQQQDSVRQMANETLAQLYEKHPAAKDAIAKSAGYAVFSDYGFEAILLGAARGKGVAVYKASSSLEMLQAPSGEVQRAERPLKQETFMEMLEPQPGMGLGAAKFRILFIFEMPKAFNSFVTSGWEAGANAMAVAKTKPEGGALANAVTISKDVKMIQLNDEGLIVGVSLTGAKFYNDKKLN